MKKNIKSVVMLLIASCAMTASLYAKDASELVDSQTLATLRRDGNIQRSYYKQGKVQLELVPATNLSQRSTEVWTDSNPPVFVIENLYMLPKTQMGTGNPAKTNIGYASQVIRSISSMQGMTYYSHKDRKNKVLYKSAYSIKGPNDRTKVSDDTAGNADGKVIYCMLDDSSFGKTNYRLEYSQTNDEVAAFFDTTTAMWVGPVKAVDAGNLKISMVIIDCDTEMMVYLLVQAKFPAISMLESMMYDSFSARLEAIYTWFLAQF